MARPRLTPLRIRAAFAVAVIADLLQFPINLGYATGLLAIPAEAADVGVDFAAMILTMGLIGFHWALLPSLALEAIPFVDALPTWTACVAFVVWRRKQELPPQSDGSGASAINVTPKAEQSSSKPPQIPPALREPRGAEHAKSN